MEVRIARHPDLIEIGRLAHEVWWEAYAGLVTSETINSSLDANYSPSVLAERLLKHYCFMAVDNGETVGFAEGTPAEDRLILETLYCREPGNHEVGRQLISRTHALAPELPMCSDVVLGHLTAESFFETIGFAPGEIIEDDLRGEHIVRRRWWLPALAPRVALPSHEQPVP
ncbi:MAG: hypothetical protein OER12_01420 [Acidimicrobiia bacterium]|nr:hypothetical protein [Acidimicrobiia bacterium]